LILFLNKFKPLRKFIPALLMMIHTGFFAGAQYWQQEVNFSIDVSLDDKSHTLDGFAAIEYINNSPDTLYFIWFHCWPNAYKHDKTALTDQMLENGNTDFYFSGREEKGYMNRLDFKVNGVTAETEDHPQHIDIIKLNLPEPLLPGRLITITTPFHVKLPFNFSRGGHDGESYQATQWYPKPAVYDRKGWHPMPYLDQGEFYSEFGRFDVRITLPENYVVAATGELQDPQEKEWLKERAGFRWEPVKQKEKTSSGETKTVIQSFPASAAKTKTLRYIQDRVHDFAWFADKRYTVQQDTLQLASGQIIRVYAYYTRADYTAWKQAVSNGKLAVRHYSELVGEYPYTSVHIVEGPESFGGGMEYPTITVISPTADVKSLEKTIVHEVGHNWFYGILANNERQHPWMDEGMNSYYDYRYTLSKYGLPPQPDRIAFETKALTGTDQPVETPSGTFSEANYGLTAYYKTAEWLRYLESQIGPAAFDKAMQDYYRRWQFRHPYPEDFKRSAEESTGRNLDSIFAYLGKPGLLPNQKRTGTKTHFIFDMKAWTEYSKTPSKNLLLFGPAIGGNSYDKLMLGAFLTNAQLPPSRFLFLAAPMYATGSKKMTGLGLLNYSLFSKGFIRRTDIGITGSLFTADAFTGNDNQNAYLGFRKIVPQIKFTLREKNPRSTFYRYLRFRTYFLDEEELRFFRDTVISGTDTSISTRFNTVEQDRTFSQLQFVIENNRALYPYRGELKLEQGKDFIRAAFTGNYFFNYPGKGGLRVRLFAGKFFYTGARTFSKQFATDRYHLNMTGANGYEDYSYSDYFIGRNKFEGLASQQIMIRDGAFKVRTDLLADKVGRTDDWLAAVNFSTTIPDQVNPLNLLPVKIPLKLFFDIGTYAETWKPDAETDRFLFDAGIHIPLLAETVNIYIPLVYSNVYRDYYQSTIPKKERFWKKISFSIDISNFSFRKIDRNFHL